jgi:hypothetical protein
MILEREHGRKPNIDQPEMKSPNRKEDKWKGIEHEFGKIKVHVVPTVTDGSWRPLTMRSTPSLLDGGSTLLFCSEVAGAARSSVILENGRRGADSA